MSKFEKSVKNTFWFSATLLCGWLAMTFLHAAFYGGYDMFGQPIFHDWMMPPGIIDRLVIGIFGAICLLASFAIWPLAILPLNEAEGDDVAF
tara:strand:- start:99 stop:374 length:276 start_codon:yes stop_codon:yes gene_type:complete